MVNIPPRICAKNKDNEMMNDCDTSQDWVSVERPLEYARSGYGEPTEED